MSDRETKKNRIVYMLFFASMILTAVLVIWAGEVRFQYRKNHVERPVNISDGWTLVRGGQEAETISLPSQVPAGPDEEIVITRRIPSIESEGTAVCFHTSFSAVQVFAGEDLLYRYDTGSTRPIGKASPSRWNLVKIPDEYSGELLSIRIRSPYSRYSGELTSVWFGDLLELTGYLVRRYLPQLLVCGAFTMLGAGLIVSSVYLRSMLRDVCTLRCLGIFIVLVSFWMMSEVDFPDILWDLSFLAYLSRYLLVMVCPLPYLMYLLHRFPERYGNCFRMLAALFSINFFVLTTLQLLDAADLAETIWITHIWVLVMLACIFVIIFKRSRRERPVSFDFKLEFIGILLLAVGILAEIRLYYLKEYMRSGDYLRLGLFAYAGCLFTALIFDIRNKREEADRTGKELQESRLRLMVSQIRPHFIYNTLSSIRTLIKLDPDQAYDLVYEFSKYLRANIDSIGQEGTIPFSKELEHIKSYCRIEQTRFGKKLSVLFEIEEEQFFVPPLTIQPLVENAIKHGIRGKEGTGTVKIHTYKNENGYLIEVVDDGAGFDAEAGSGPGSAGLTNIRIRLNEIADSSLEITSIPGKGTKAVVYVPKRSI